MGLFCAALVLVATCFVTGAWAKYTKSVTASDSARVAKFNVELTDGTNPVTQDNQIAIFDTAFQNIKQTDGINSDGSTNLIAPGSYGEFTIVVNSTSEVSVECTLTGNADLNGIPLEFSIDNQTWNGSLATVLGSCTHTFNVNDAASLVAQTYRVQWRWSYEGNDTSDTILGEAGNALATVTITCTATQVQPA